MTIVATLLAPFVHPVAYELVCSVRGTRLVATDGPSTTATSDSLPGDRHDDGAHCPLCMPAGAPPTTVAWDFTPVQPLAHVRQRIPAARLAGLLGAPLPARGPPSAS